MATGLVRTRWGTGGTVHVNQGYGRRAWISATPEPGPLNPDADIRRLVTIDPANSEAPGLLPLETANTYLSVRDKLHRSRPQERKPSEVGSGRRYQGTRIVSETRSNAAVAWKVLVKGPTADDVASNIRTLIAEFEGLLNQ